MPFGRDQKRHSDFRALSVSSFRVFRGQKQLMATGAKAIRGARKICVICGFSLTQISHPYRCFFFFLLLAAVLWLEDFLPLVLLAFELLLLFTAGGGAGMVCRLAARAALSACAF